MWRITLEITDEMTKIKTQRNSEQIAATISRKHRIRQRTARNEYIANIKSKAVKPCR